MRACSKCVPTASTHTQTTSLLTAAAQYEVRATRATATADMVKRLQIFGKKIIFMLPMYYFCCSKFQLLSSLGDPETATCKRSSAIAKAGSL